MKSGVAKGAERDLSKYFRRVADPYPDRKNPSYIVVSGQHYDNNNFSFRETVDRCLDDGWSLQGGVSASDAGLTSDGYPTGVTLHQALTREVPTSSSAAVSVAEDPSSTTAAAAVGGAGGGGAKAPARKRSRRSNRKRGTRRRKN